MSLQIYQGSGGDCSTVHVCCFDNCVGVEKYILNEDSATIEDYNIHLVPTFLPSFILIPTFTFLLTFTFLPTFTFLMDIWKHVYVSVSVELRAHEDMMLLFWTPFEGEHFIC